MLRNINKSLNPQNASTLLELNSTQMHAKNANSKGMTKHEQLELFTLLDKCTRKELTIFLFK